MNDGICLRVPNEDAFEIRICFKISHSQINNYLGE